METTHHGDDRDNQEVKRVAKLLDVCGARIELWNREQQSPHPEDHHGKEERAERARAKAIRLARCVPVNHHLPGQPAVDRDGEGNRREDERGRQPSTGMGHGAWGLGWGTGEEASHRVNPNETRYRTTACFSLQLLATADELGSLRYRLTTRTIHESPTARAHHRGARDSLISGPCAGAFASDDETGR